MPVDEIDKPGCQWCKFVERTATGRRCGVYYERPDACRTFECIWLQSQVRIPANGFPAGQVLPPDLRPDRCHVVFCQDAYLTGPVDPNERHMVLFVDPVWPDAWRTRRVMAQVDGFLARDTPSVRCVVEIIIGSQKITRWRGPGGIIFERVDPYLGMLKREVMFPSNENFTFDPTELMGRGR